MSQSSAVWGTLVKDVLIQIFEHLDTEDLKAVSLTCKHWWKVSSLPQFVQRFKVFIYNKEERDQFPLKTKIPSVLELMAKSSRNFECFFFQRIKLDGELADGFWTRFAPVITELTFVGCQIKSQYLVQLLKKMPNLHSLNFCEMETRKNWRIRDFDRLKGRLNIRHLGWGDVNMIDEVMFNAIFGMANSSLESFRLSGVTPNSANKKVMTLAEYREVIGQCLTATTFQNFVLKQKNLKKVELLEQGPIQFTIQELLKAPVKLDIVILVSYPAEVSSTDLNAFLWNQKQLRELYMCQMPTTNESMWAISEMANLTDLSIVQDPKCGIEDEGFELVKKVKSLKSLTLKNFNRITSDGFNTFFEALDMSRLDYLHMSQFRKLEETSFHVIIPRMVCLTSIHLQNCGRLVDDKVLLAIFESLVKLVNLTLIDLKYVTKAGFFGDFGISNLRCLKHFHVELCPIFADDCLDTIDGLKALNIVDILECPKVTNAGLKSFLRRFPGFELKRGANQIDALMEKTARVALAKDPVVLKCSTVEIK